MIWCAYAIRQPDLIRIARWRMAWSDSEFNARASTPHPFLSLPARVVISAGLQLPVADFSLSFATATRQKDGGTSVSDCRRVTVFADDSSTSYTASVNVARTCMWALMVCWWPLTLATNTACNSLNRRELAATAKGNLQLTLIQALTA